MHEPFSVGCANGYRERLRGREASQTPVRFFGEVVRGAIHSNEPERRDRHWFRCPASFIRSAAKGMAEFTRAMTAAFFRGDDPAKGMAEFTRAMTAASFILMDSRLIWLGS